MSRLLLALLFGSMLTTQDAWVQQPYVQANFYYADSVITVSNLTEWQPEHTAPYDRPDIYKKWWKEISDCAGLRGNLKKIHWHWATWPADTSYGDGYFRCPNDSKRTGWCDGWWSANKRHDIYIGKTHMDDQRVIKHEMLHDLLGKLNGKALGPHHPLFKKCKVST